MLHNLKLFPSRSYFFLYYCKFREGNRPAGFLGVPLAEIIVPLVCKLSCCTFQHVRHGVTPSGSVQ